MFLNFLFLALILEKGEGREKERERNIDVGNVDWLPPICTLTVDGTCKPGMCPDQESNGMDTFQFVGQCPTN